MISVSKPDPTHIASVITEPRQTRPSCQCGNQAPYDREADTSDEEGARLHIGLRSTTS